MLRAKRPDDLACRGSLRIGRLAVEAPEGPLGDDAPMLAGEFCVGRERPCRREVKIAFDDEAELAAKAFDVSKTNVAEFGKPLAEVIETEGSIRVIRVELGQ
jgi:hypothetical protein